MKIFYSWQMDIPADQNKRFIESCLTEAIKQLQAEIELNPAERPEIDLQSDTKGVLGSPEILPTILNRIKECDVFVGDVTLTGKGKSNSKDFPNPNVSLELGYAAAFTENFEKILLVMNTDYGSWEQLPFDFRNRRKPVGYVVSQKQQFVGELKSILRAYVTKFQEEKRGVLELDWNVDKRYGPTDFGLKFGIKNIGPSVEKNLAIKFYNSESFDSRKLLVLDNYGTNWWHFQQESDHKLLRLHDNRPIYQGSTEWACKYDNGVVHSSRPGRMTFQKIEFKYEILSEHGISTGHCSISGRDFQKKI